MSLGGTVQDMYEESLSKYIPCRYINVSFSSTS